MSPLYFKYPRMVEKDYYADRMLKEFYSCKNIFQQSYLLFEFINCGAVHNSGKLQLESVTRQTVKSAL